MPKQSANPTIGKIGQLEFVEEDRVELVVNDKGKHEELKCAITELKNVRIEHSWALSDVRLEGRTLTIVVFRFIRMKRSLMMSIRLKTSNFEAAKE
jgi:hypothetical protein